MPSDTYTIVDLARLTGVNVRTIRYYLAQGLLPASGESGPGSHYGDGHLDRLRLTKRLQQQHLPLSEIRRRLADLTDAEVANLSSEPAEPAASTSALEYVRGVLGAPATSASSVAVGSSVRRTALPRIALPPASRVADAPTGITGNMSIAPAPMSTPPAMPIPPGAPSTAHEPRTEPQPLERSQWERLSLGPDIELHVRRPLGRLEQRRVERLITIARQVLKEEKP
jgi:DNA-binding transcriptional MerR regulator